MKIPVICPISQLAREARALVERARQSQEPIVITQRGRDAAVLVPIELYRQLERRPSHRLISPRLVHSEDAERFAMTVTAIDVAEERTSADV